MRTAYGTLTLNNTPEYDGRTCYFFSEEHALFFRADCHTALRSSQNSHDKRWHQHRYVATQALRPKESALARAITRGSHFITSSFLSSHPCANSTNLVRKINEIISNRVFYRTGVHSYPPCANSITCANSTPFTVICTINIV